MPGKGKVNPVKMIPTALGAMLLDAELVTAGQLEEAEGAAGEFGGFLGQALVSLGHLKETDLISLLVRRCKVPHLNLLDYNVDNDVVKLVPPETCAKHNLLPIDKMGKHVTLAMVNPLDMMALAEVSAALSDCKIKRILCSYPDFLAVSNKIFGTKDKKDGGDTDTFGLGPAPPEPKPAPAPKKEVKSAAPVDSALATMKVERKPVNPKAMRQPKRACLVCLDGWEIGQEIALDKVEHVLGRSRDTDTCLDSQLVSREHAKIVHMREYGDEHFMITDLGSSNGTYVNNVPITSTSLHDGDKILVGDVLLKFLIQDEVEARFQREMHKLIHYHKQTGLLRIDAFTRQLEREIVRRKKGGSMTLAMTDLDGLKQVNDTYGHIAGSGVLSDMGGIIRKSIRDQDYAGLYGGDEAIILFVDTPIEGGFALAEDLRRSIEASVFRQKSNTFNVTMSIGLAEWPKHGRTAAELVAAADKALYAAKESGRNRTCMVAEAP